MKRAFPSGLCPLCGGERVSGRITFSADIGVGVVVVRNVPATVCDQCGAEWIDNPTAQRLEGVVDEARNRGTQVEVMSLP